MRMSDAEKLLALEGVADTHGFNFSQLLIGRCCSGKSASTWWSVERLLLETPEQIFTLVKDQHLFNRPRAKPELTSSSSLLDACGQSMYLGLKDGTLKRLQLFMKIVFTFSSAV